MTGMWWLSLAIAAAGCRAERSEEPPRGLADVAPPPVRVELGACDEVKPFFVGAARTQPQPGSWFIGLPGGTIATGRIGIIHRGHAEKPATVRLDTIDTEAPFKADVRRQLARWMLKVEYCYQKQLVVDGPRFTGALDIELDISADGTLASPPKLSDETNATFATCVQDYVAKELAFTAPKRPLVAHARVLLDPGDCRDCREPQTLLPNPLRADDLAACVRTMPSPVGVYVIDFKLAGAEVQQVAVQGGSDPGGCVAAIAKTIEPPAAVPEMRCSFAFGVASPRPDAIIKLGENGALRHGEGEIQPEDLSHFVVEQRVSDFALDRRGPIQLQVEDGVAMGRVAQLVDDIEHFDAGVVFVMPHPFGGPPRFLGRTLPAAPVAPGEYKLVRTPAHHVAVRPNVLSVDGEPVASWDALASRLRELRATTDPRLEIRADPRVRFGDFAHAVDVVVAAGFTDWQMWH